MKCVSRIAFVPLALAAACSRPIRSTDALAWVEPPTARSALFFRSELPDRYFSEVVPARREKAIAALQANAFSKIRQAEAETYSASLKPGEDGAANCYLVRALKASGRATFNVYYVESEIYVFSGALGRRTRPYKTALVVCVSGELWKAYVGYAVAE